MCVYHRSRVVSRGVNNEKQPSALCAETFSDDSSCLFKVKTNWQFSLCLKVERVLHLSRDQAEHDEGIQYYFKEYSKWNMLFCDLVHCRSHFAGVLICFTCTFRKEVTTLKQFPSGCLIPAGSCIVWSSTVVKRQVHSFSPVAVVSFSLCRVPKGVKVKVKVRKAEDLPVPSPGGPWLAGNLRAAHYLHCCTNTFSELKPITCLGKVCCTWKYIWGKGRFQMAPYWSLHSSFANVGIYEAQYPSSKRTLSHQLWPCGIQTSAEWLSDSDLPAACQSVGKHSSTNDW